MTCFKYFSSFLQVYLFGIKGVNIWKICIRRVYNKDVYIKGISICANYVYIRDIDIKNIYIKIFYINNIYISTFDIIKYLEIYLQLSQIFKLRLFDIVWKTKLGTN